VISCKDIILTVRLEQIGIDRVSGVENCLRMAYVCQQEQDSSTLKDMGAGGLGRGGSRHLPTGVGFACEWCALSMGSTSYRRVNHPNSDPLAKENITFPPGVASFVKEIHSAPLKTKKFFGGCSIRCSQTPSSISIVTSRCAAGPDCRVPSSPQNSGGTDDSPEFSTVPLSPSNSRDGRDPQFFLGLRRADPMYWSWPMQKQRQRFLGLPAPRASSSSAFKKWLNMRILKRAKGSTVVCIIMPCYSNNS
jgi:hypothetical protein